MKTCPVCDTDYPDQHTNCAADGAVLIVSRELVPGSLVRGKYRIVRKLGQGGMGIVYLAEDSLLGVNVALKFLAGDLGKDPRFIKRFRTEARAAYQLRHPNIAEVTNLDQDEDGSLFIAMEYIEGPSLRAVLDQNPKGLAIPRALEIAKGIASGLAAAHAQGTIHRDIKPENILITRAADDSERAKVLDFGIAAVAESVTKMTRTQGFILTYAYAAPEQWQEMPADQMDGRTDLYALGCVLYEMLTGATPFHAHTTAGWMKAHCEEAPKPPSNLRPEILQWSNLDALVAFSLAKSRNRRPHNVIDMLSLLATVSHNEAPRPQATPTTIEKPRPTEVESAAVRPAAANPARSPRVVSEPPQPLNANPPLQLKQINAFRSSRIHLWVWRGIGIVALAAFVTIWWLGRPRPGPVPELADIPHHQSPSVGNTGSSADQQSHPPQHAGVLPREITSSQRQGPSMALPTSAENPYDQAVQAEKRGDTTQVASLYEQACNQGNAKGCDRLGVLYRGGFGNSPADHQKSNTFFQKAEAIYQKGCDSGNSKECFHSGEIYMALGQDQSALVPYRKACDGNAPEGCFELALLSQDPRSKLALFEEACTGGDPYGCRKASGYYVAGIGAERDLGKGKQLLQKACTLGDKESCKELQIAF